jgi:hypothetical protein
LRLDYAGFGEEAGYFRAGEVGLLALETAVADGQDGGPDVDLEEFCHLTSVLERLGEPAGSSACGWNWLTISRYLPRLRLK